MNTNHLIIDNLLVDDLIKLSQNAQSEQELLNHIQNWTETAKKFSSWLNLSDLIAVARADKEGNFRKVSIREGLLESPDSSVVKSCIEVQKYLGVKVKPKFNDIEEVIEFEYDGESPEDVRNIYGVNTGFGSFRKHILKDVQDANQISQNIIFSHCTGVGNPLPIDVVRAIMLLRIKCFCQGISGIRPLIIKRLVQMLNAGVVPYVPSKGSVGSSGDLAPLSHLFAVMLGKGYAWWIPNGKALNGEYDVKGKFELEIDPKEPFADRMNRLNQSAPYVLLKAKEALLAAGIKPIDPSTMLPKEGLAMTNGTSVSTALFALGVFDAQNIYETANSVSSVTLQTMGGMSRAFEAHIHAFRPQTGQIVTAWKMRNNIAGSQFVNKFADTGETQDDYSIRAIPQVHGTVLNGIYYAKDVAEREINSVTDNPLFFNEVIRQSGIDFQFASDSKYLQTTHASAANFHGEQIGSAADTLKIALSELANISERRIQLLLDSNSNRGIPANLTLGKYGLHTGWMIAQYTAAALVSDNKVLSHPSSVDSIPTSANAEDYVAMATNSARHLREVVFNSANVIAIEMLCALQALDIRLHQWNGDLKQFSNDTQRLYDLVRNILEIKFVPYDSENVQKDVAFNLSPDNHTTFEQHAPSEMIRTITKEILNGNTVRYDD